MIASLACLPAFVGSSLLPRDAGVIVAQNRSHFVNSSTHPQFKALDAWISQHAADLYELLRDGRILFGEWLYAQHSIAYNALPSYFLAFDVYDRAAGAFLPRDARDALLAPTAIVSVPLLAARPLSGPADLLALLETDVRQLFCKMQRVYAYPSWCV